MRAAVIDQFGLDHLRLVEEPVPKPQSDQLLLRIRAVSLNYRDVLVAQGKYDARFKLPLVLGSDAVGEVVERGPSAKTYEIGTRVCPIFAPTWLDGPPTRRNLRTTLGGPLSGVLAEYVTVSEQAVVRPPDYLTDVEAACLPCAAVTAYNALFTLGDLQARQWVLCLGTGGVSTFALQFAKAAGANVVVASKSSDKRKRALELGADHTIDYVQEPHFGKRVRELCDGVHHVIEVAGGSLEESLRALRPGGTVYLIGVLSGYGVQLELLPILMNQLRVQGVLVGSRRCFEDMVQFMDAHRIVPSVDRSFGLDDVERAFEYLTSQAHVGKVCIELS